MAKITESEGVVNIFTLALLFISLSPFLGNAPDTGNASKQSANEKSETSGTFQLSEKEPTKRLSLHGKTGIARINNIGPAGLTVKNSLNNMTLGANTHADLNFEGDTDLSVATSASSRQTHGTFEILVKE